LHNSDSQKHISETGGYPSLYPNAEGNDHSTTRGTRSVGVMLSGALAQGPYNPMAPIPTLEPPGPFVGSQFPVTVSPAAVNSLSSFQGIPAHSQKVTTLNTDT